MQIHLSATENLFGPPLPHPCFSWGLITCPKISVLEMLTYCVFYAYSAALCPEDSSSIALADLCLCTGLYGELKLHIYNSNLW